MTLIDNCPNSNRIITIIEAMMLTDKEHKELIKISKQIKKYYETELNCNIEPLGLVKYYIEQTIEKSKRFNNYSQIKKEIIIANIFLPDQYEIAELLNQNGYTIEKLKSIMRTRAILKNTLINSISINNDLITKFITYKQEVIKLLEIFKSHFKITDQTIILNRICEILVKNPYYFESKANINNKTKRK